MAFYKMLKIHEKSDFIWQPPRMTLEGLIENV